MNIGNIAHHKGKLAEQQAAHYLQQHGLRVIQRNYRCKGGEIDIIAQDGRILVFIEVRSRATSSFGMAAESITINKQKRVILAARHYLMQRANPLPICRFDAILIDEGKLIWEKNCFQLN